MKYLPLLNILLIVIVPYLVKHEKEHTRIWLLIRQVCTKLHIDSGE
jgi:hypothetical protein